MAQNGFGGETMQEEQDKRERGRRTSKIPSNALYFPTGIDHPLVYTANERGPHPNLRRSGGLLRADLKFIRPSFIMHQLRRTRFMEAPEVPLVDLGILVRVWRLDGT